MIFNQTVMYALRAMHQLAMDYGEQYIRSADLAQKTSVPSHYLLKIMHKLVERGLLHAHNGRYGGYRLARAPGAIRVEEVLEAMDVPLYTSECAFGWAKCDPARPCPLHWAWTDLTDKVKSWAAETSLAQLEHPDAPLTLPDTK